MRAVTKNTGHGTIVSMQDTKQPTCHPDKEYAARGLCKACYQQKWRANRGFATKIRERGLPNECGHPERKHWGLGKCRSCYGKHTYDSAVTRQRRYGNPDRIRRQWEVTLKKMYGLSADDYEAMHKSQDGKCAVCGKQETKKLHGKTKRLAVDHCHTSGRIRSLLCQNCNNMLGHSHESVATLKNAIVYLQISNAMPPVPNGVVH